MTTDISNWDYYYNIEDNEYGRENVRANLVYTPRVSPDKKTFCMDFTRDINYHNVPEENVLWTDDELTKRFNREIKSHGLVKHNMPTLAIRDVDVDKRRIFIEWHGDDLCVQAFPHGGDFSKVLPDWREQWLSMFKTMMNLDLYKISLHPNSFVAHNGVLIPFNWFFTYERYEPKVRFRDLMMQISSQRQSKLGIFLDHYGVTLDTPLDLSMLQTIALNSFRSNYPKDLIDEALTYVQ